ncbi:MAG: DinB family protein [Acidobacteriota bacterium]
MEQPFPRPGRDEAAPYYDTYIRLVPEGDIVGVLAAQLEPSLTFFRSISAEKSLHRYAAGKWSVRQLLNHISDTERVMLFRAYWFARHLGGSLPGMDQDVAAAAGRADEVSWDALIGEFQTVREATLSFFRNLPAEAWSGRGTASDSPVTTRALAYIIAGHNLHHQAILRDRYL